MWFIFALGTASLGFGFIGWVIGLVVGLEEGRRRERESLARRSLEPKAPARDPLAAAVDRLGGRQIG